MNYRHVLAWGALCVTLGGPAQAAFDRWTPWGPSNHTFVQLLVDATDGNQLYARGAQGVVYRSRDAGRTWAWAGRGLASSWVDGLVAGSGRRLWALTNSAGLWASDDGAGSWRLVNAQPQCLSPHRLQPGHFSGFVVVPGSPDLLLALCQERLWQSADAGVTWASTATPANVFGLWADPAAPSHLLVSSPGGPLASLDGGATWHNVSPLTDPTTGSVLVAGVVPAGPTTLFVRVIGHLPQRGLYRSADWGATWQQLPGTDEAEFFVASVGFDPTRPRRTVFTGSGVFCSEDLGSTFAECGPGGVPPTTAGQVAFEPTGSAFYLRYGNLLARRGAEGTWQPATVITGAGAQSYVSGLPRFAQGRTYSSFGTHLFRSDDQGATWRGPNFDPVLPPCGFEVDLIPDPARAGRLVAATICGVFETLDDGVTWRLLRAGGVVSALPLGAREVVAASCDVLRTTDSGRTWRVVLRCPVTPAQEVQLPPQTRLLQDPRRPRVLYALSHNGNHPSETPSRVVHRSLDGGATWRPLVRDSALLAFDPRRTTTLYTVVRGAVLRSTDDGRRWTVRGPLVPNPEIAVPLDLIVDPENSDRLYARVRTGQLLRSRDGGATWAPAETGAPVLFPFSYYGLAADPPGGQGRIFQGTSLGLYWVKFTD